MTRATWTDEMVAEVRRLAKNGLTDVEIAQSMGLRRSAICGARWRFKIHTDFKPRSATPPPADFILIAPRLNIKAAALHYGVATQTICGWHKKSCTKPAKYVRPKKPREPKFAKPDAPSAAVDTAPAPRRVWRQSGKAPSALPIARDFTAAGQAQLFLQRFGPVFRASTLNPGATGWIMFGRPVSEEDLIANAHRKGFRSEAMAA